MFHSPANSDHYSTSHIHSGACEDGEEAANESTSHRRASAVDLNTLVVGVVGHVLAKASSPHLDLEVVLAAGHHAIDGDPVALAFALSGILTAHLAALDEVDGDVRVATAADTHGVRVTISAGGVPSLGLVRALACDGDAGASDPTLSHCRRLIEDQGGSLRLVESHGRIAVRVALPRVLPSNVVPLHATHPGRARATVKARLVA